MQSLIRCVFVVEYYCQSFERAIDIAFSCLHISYCQKHLLLADGVIRRTSHFPTRRITTFAVLHSHQCNCLPNKHISIVSPEGSYILTVEIYQEEAISESMQRQFKKSIQSKVLISSSEMLSSFSGLQHQNLYKCERRPFFVSGEVTSAPECRRHKYFGMLTLQSNKLRYSNSNPGD